SFSRDWSSDVCSSDLGHLALRDIAQLLHGHRPSRAAAWSRAALLQLRRLLDEPGHRGCLGDEGERPVGIDGDYRRRRDALILTLGLRVERLAELHDVEPGLAQRRPDGGRRVCLPRRNLELDVSGNLLCHLFPELLLKGAVRPWRASRTQQPVCRPAAIPFRPANTPVPPESRGRRWKPPP